MRTIADLITSILLFAAYFFYDLLYTKWIIYVSKKKSIAAANTSVGIYVIGAYGTIVYVANYWFLIPILLGAWLGTFIAVKRNR